MTKSLFLQILKKYEIYLIIAALIIIKIPYLNLPLYWDEAWSYARAIFDMNDKGLAILPGGANTELTRGHPLLFYFSAALWMKAFGSSLLSCHSFALLISGITLLAIYKLCIDLLNRTTAIITVLFMLSQSYFLAQSTLLLPEVFLTLFTILSINAYFKKQWGLFALFSSMLVMTKETGLVLIMCFLFDKIILSNIIHPEERKMDKKFFKEMTYVSLPVLVFSLFLIIQKIRLDWFLFPDHINMIKFELHHTLYCLKEISKILFYQNGRKILMIIIPILTIYVYYRRKNEKEKNHLLIFIILFVFLYLLFSSINFFTNRYILSVLPLYLIICSYIISLAFKGHKYMMTLLAISLFAFFCYKTYFIYWDESDVSLGYVDTVKLHKEVVNYCENKQWQNKYIYTGFLMAYNFKDPHLGYLKNKSMPFKKASNVRDKNYEIHVYYSIDGDPAIDSMRNNKSYSLVKRFEKGSAWAEIYQQTAALLQ